MLFLPSLAVQFTDEVVWNLADFAITGLLLGGDAMAYERVARQGGTTVYRDTVGVALATALLLLG